ncbi:uncharacterized protein LOC119376200 [Rhipicephalus sanguineus]|uniref:uncharacterized protein LOC119376200 n=1 Tax=Rhipicephalus sanguineus TaxID=34632 RepID=UPI0020C1FD0F|nr:uncharacterized protein LOC119376200 [Rhipicephalus sanguineus]
MATDQATPVASSYEHWNNVVGGAENVEPDAPPLAVDSTQLPKRRARRRGFRMRGGDEKPQGAAALRSEHAGSIGSAAQLQHDRGGKLEAPLFSALFLLTSLLFLVSLLSLYYSIAFSHLRRWLRLTEEYDDCRTKFCCIFSARVKSVRNESTNLCEDIYTPLCSTVNVTCPDAEITTRHHPWSVSLVLTKRLLGLAEVLRSPEALKNPASNASAFLFRSCLARGQRLSVHNDVRRLLSSVGLSSWPLWENQSADVAFALTALLRDFAAPFVVTLSVGNSIMNSDALSIYLDAPELLLGPTSWQLTITTDETDHDAKENQQHVYEKYALAILYEVLPDDASSGALSRLATELYAFEQALTAHIPRGSTYVDRVVVRLAHLQDSYDLVRGAGQLPRVAPGRVRRLVLFSITARPSTPVSRFGSPVQAHHRDCGIAVRRRGLPAASSVEQPSLQVRSVAATQEPADAFEAHGVVAQDGYDSYLAGFAVGGPGNSGARHPQGSKHECVLW